MAVDSDTALLLLLFPLCPYDTLCITSVGVRIILVRISIVFLLILMDRSYISIEKGIGWSGLIAIPG